MAEVSFDEKRPVDFARRPQSHPVYSTGVQVGSFPDERRPVLCFDVNKARHEAIGDSLAVERCRQLHQATLSPGITSGELVRLQTDFLTDVLDQSKVFAPLHIPPLDEPLPMHWAPAEQPLSLDEQLDARRTLFVSLPLNMFSSPYSMEPTRKTAQHETVAAAWAMLVTALASCREGSWSRGGDRYYFHAEHVLDELPPEEAAAPAVEGDVRSYSARRTVIKKGPKIVVFTELLVSDFRGRLLQYIHRVYGANVPLTGALLQAVIKEPKFRDELQSNRNVVGVRFIIHAIDPKLDFGRSIQHALWANQVIFGKASPAEIYDRYQLLKAGWIANRPHPADTTPELDDEALIDEELRFQNEALGDADAEAGAAAAAAAAGKGPKGPSRAELEKKRVMSIEKLMSRIGVNIGQLTRDPKALDRAIRHLPEDGPGKADANGMTVSSTSAAAAAASGRGGRAFNTPEAEARRKLEEQEGWFRRGIYTQTDIIRKVFGPLTCQLYDRDPELRTVTEDMDMGSFSYPYHVSKVFTFDQSIKVCTRVDSLGKTVSVCPEQCDSYNYMAPESTAFHQRGEFTFPLPTLAWRLPTGEHGFNLATLRCYRACWYFSAFLERMDQVEAEIRKDEREMRAHNRPITEADMDVGGTDEGARLTRLMNEERAGMQAQIMSSIINDPTGVLAMLADERRSDGYLNPHEQLLRQQRAIFIVDAMHLEVARAKRLQQRLDWIVQRKPVYRSELYMLFREHMFHSVFLDKIRPGVVDMNDIHQSHTTMFHRQDTDGQAALAPLFPLSHMHKNLTMDGSIIAEFLLRLRQDFGLRHSERVVFFMILQMSPNAYDFDRLCPLNLLKFGPPGMSKSYMDKVFMTLKAEGTAVEANHESHLCRYVETVQDNRSIIHDETASALVNGGNGSADAKSFNQAQTTKMNLSEDAVSWTVLAIDQNTGKRSEQRRRVSARTNSSYNSNWMLRGADRALADRLLVMYVVPSCNATAIQSEIAVTGQNQEMAVWQSEMTAQMQKLDTVTFLISTMMNVRAAPHPDIRVYAQDMATGMRAVQRMSPMRNTSMRGIRYGLELATRLTVSMASLRMFSTHFNPAVRRVIDANGEARTDLLPWDDKYLLNAKYHLFAGPEICCFALSQFHRNMLRVDYIGWDEVNAAGRAVLGFSEAYFEQLVKDSLWEDMQVDDKRHPGRKITKRKQRVPFHCIERLLKHRPKREDLPQYVHDAEAKNRHYEMIGIQHRLRGRRVQDAALMVPSFLMYQIQDFKDSADVIVDQQDARAEHREELLSAEAARKASSSKAGPNPSNPRAELGAAGGVGAAEKAQKRADPHKGAVRIVVDRNFIVFCGSMEMLANAIAALTGRFAHKHPHTIRQILEGFVSSDIKCEVPVLALSASISEPMLFEYELRGGQQRVVTRAERVIQECSGDKVLRDVIGNSGPYRGPYVLISTWALVLFKPLFSLFEFLAASESEHTPHLTVPIDLAMPCFEALHYTHEMRPNKKKQRLVDAAVHMDAVMARTLYRLHTCADLVCYDTDAARAARQRQAAAAQAVGALPGGESRADGLTMEGLVPPPNTDARMSVKRLEEAVGRARADLVTPAVDDADFADALRTKLNVSTGSNSNLGQPRDLMLMERENSHLAPQLKFSSAFQETARTMNASKSVYPRNYYQVEYERFLEEQCGVEITPEVGSAWYYPGNADLIVEHLLATDPFYKRLRQQDGGERLVYPTDQYESLKRSDELQPDKSKRTYAEDGILDRQDVVRAYIEEYRVAVRKATLFKPQAPPARTAQGGSGAVPFGFAPNDPTIPFQSLTAPGLPPVRPVPPTEISLGYHAAQMGAATGGSGRSQKAAAAPISVAASPQAGPEAGSIADMLAAMAVSTATDTGAPAVTATAPIISPESKRHQREEPESTPAPSGGEEEEDYNPLSQSFVRTQTPMVQREGPGRRLALAALHEQKPAVIASPLHEMLERAIKKGRPQGEL